MSQKPRVIPREDEGLFQPLGRPVVPKQQVSSILTVQRHLRQASTVVATDDESETLEVARFEVEPAEVSLELGTTVNMGDYETVRVTVGVRIPCYVEELVAAYADAENFVKTRLTKERDEVVEWAKKRGARNTNNIF